MKLYAQFLIIVLKVVEICGNFYNLVTIMFLSLLGNGLETIWNIKCLTESIVIFQIILKFTWNCETVKVNDGTYDLTGHLCGNAFTSNSCLNRHPARAHSDQVQWYKGAKLLISVDFLAVQNSSIGDLVTNWLTH